MPTGFTTDGVVGRGGYDGLAGDDGSNDDISAEVPVLREEFVFCGLGGGAGGINFEAVLPVRMTGRGARAGLRIVGVDGFVSSLLSSINLAVIELCFLGAFPGKGAFTGGSLYAFRLIVLVRTGVSAYERF